MPDTDTAVKPGFAELEFPLGDDPAWPKVRSQLNGTVPDSAQIAQAGAASLIARDLALVAHDGAILISEQAVMGTVADYLTRFLPGDG